MATNIQEEFEQIVKSEKLNKVYSFLEGLSQQERKSLNKTIRTLNKYFSDFVQTNNSWQYRGSTKQREIIGIAAFVCFSGKEYTRNTTSWIGREQVDKILKFYVPEWFNEYINTIKSNDFALPFWMEYEWMMELKKKGVLIPSPELIVRTLPNFLYDNEKRNKKEIRVRKDNKLFIYPETIKEHIWYFFEFDSDLHWTGQYWNYGEEGREENLSWKTTFKNLVEQGAIDRIRLLKACLSATNMNFNKNLTGWFIGLFEELEPTEEEVIKIQSEMNGVFSCPHSKPHNVILSYFKKYCINSKFKKSEFFDNISVLLSSETKTTVKNTLIIIEKILDKTKTNKKSLCIQTVGAFLNKDSAIQLKAAKIIVKHGNIKDNELKQEINNYSDLLLSETKNHLDEFLVDFADELIEEENERIIEESIKIISESTKVNIPDNIDDLMFFASQAFDNNDPLHFDILPAALVNLNNEITAKNIDSFEPALQRAYKLVLGDWRSGIGLLDHMLAIFFIEYIDILIERFDDSSLNIIKVKDKYLKIERDNIKKFNAKGKFIYQLIHWKDESRSPIFDVFRNKLQDALKIIHSNNNLPLISTPTHSLNWIDPQVIINRLKQYQEKGIKYGHTDFQLAISRTYLEESEEYLNKVKSELNGEERRLLSFLFEKDSKPEEPFNDIASWWACSVTKQPFKIHEEFNRFIYAKEPVEKYNGNYSWKVEHEFYKSKRYDYAAKKEVEYDDDRKILKIDLYPKVKELSSIAKVFKKTISPETGKSMMIYDTIMVKSNWALGSEHDTKRFLGLIPNYPDSILAHLTSYCLKYPDLWGEDYKRILIHGLEQQLENPLPFGEMGRLFLAGSLITSDKTVRTLAGELWIRTIERGLIKNEVVGQILGKYFYIPFAPLKRFTNLIEESLTKISVKHNVALQILMENLMLGMNPKPIKGLKKLIEIYNELLNINNSKVPSDLFNIIDKWSETKSLQSIIRKLPR